jgi:hypothetical protein
VNVDQGNHDDQGDRADQKCQVGGIHDPTHASLAAVVPAGVGAGDQGPDVDSLHVT